MSEQLYIVKDSDGDYIGRDENWVWCDKQALSMTATEALAHPLMERRELLGNRDADPTTWRLVATCGNEATLLEVKR